MESKMRKVLFGCAALFGAALLVGCGGDKKVEERVAQIQSNAPVAAEQNATVAPILDEKNETAKAAAVKVETDTKAETPKKDVSKALTSSPAEGKAIFGTRCAACHGQNGEGKASYPKLTGLSKDDVLRMLKGYVDGSYGKAQKMIMAGQAKGLDDSQRAAVAEYISTLK